jgi:CheY-like chemotaxis protein
MTRSEKPDLILMDMSLPVLDGWEATRQIKSDADIKHIPIIGLTAHAMVGDRDKAIQAGCNDYATKPVEFEKLVGLINRLIGV